MNFVPAPPAVSGYFGRRASIQVTLSFLCLLSAHAFAQVTINAGSGAGAFQCNEGAAPSFTSATDVLWCDSSHWLMMNNNNSAASTSIMGVVGSDADNTISIGAVDGSFNPSFLTVSGGLVTINGATTNFVAFIDGQRMIVSTNQVSSTSLAVSSFNFVYLKKDATIISADLAATTFLPVYGRTQPTCSSTATPQFWFDTATRKMKSCASSGSYAANPVIFLGVIATDASNVSLGIAHEPWRLDPYTRVREFGTGADGLTSVATTVTNDGWKQYSALEITTGGILQHTAISSPSSPGLIAYSQNPVLVVGTGKIDLAQLGRAGATGAVGVGPAGNGCGWGGAAGGGGSSGTLGGTGGSRTSFFGAVLAGGGAAVSGTSGGTGQAPTNIPPLSGQMLLISGCGGGAGAGDGANLGGSGGKGGGGIYLKAPSVIIGASATVDADAGSGGGGAAGNASGGGGGGGGVIIIDTWFEESSITPTAAAGSGGGHFGSGSNGGAGGAGIVQVIQHQ